MKDQEIRPRPEFPRDSLPGELIGVFNQFQVRHEAWLDKVGSPYGPDGDSLNREQAWLSQDNVRLNDFSKAMQGVLEQLRVQLGVPGRPYNLYREDPEDVAVRIKQSKGKFS